MRGVRKQVTPGSPRRDETDYIMRTEIVEGLSRDGKLLSYLVRTNRKYGVSILLVGVDAGPSGEHIPVIGRQPTIP